MNQFLTEEKVAISSSVFIEAAPLRRCMDLLDTSKRNGKNERKKRTATMGKKIRALERKISGF
jgi:hypothetical protein